MDDEMTALIGMITANATVSLVALYFGWRFKERPPSKINRFHGYRTRRSMMNMDTWRYAHKCCGELWWKMGRWMLILSLAVLVAARAIGGANLILTAGITALVVQSLILSLSYFKVEKELKSVFDEEGRRRS